MTRFSTALTLFAVLLLAAVLGWRWQNKSAQQLPGVKLVVFGPSSWDTFAPGAPEAKVNAVTSALDQRFRLEHPEVGSIVHDSRGSVSDGLARLRNAQVAGDQLDVVVCAANPVNTAYARLGLIKPLDGLVAGLRQRFIPGAVENFTVDGKVWGVPLSAVNLTTFFYNRDLFERAGLLPPKTFQEFKLLAPKLKAMGIIPVVHQGKVAWMWPLYYESAVVQASNNRSEEFVADLLSGKERFDGPKHIHALALMRAWVDTGVLDSQSNELDDDSLKTVFYSGKAAAYFGGSWDLASHAVNANFHWGVFPFPQYQGEPGRPQAFGGAEAGLCLAANTRQPELAQAYIEFAARDVNVRELLAPLKPFATSHMGVAGSDDPVSQAMRAQLPAAKFLDWLYPVELTETLQRETQAMMGLSKTPEQVATAMQSRYELLVQAGYIYRKTATP